jgi:scyllo-inositol 2-dehydrogenase (NADP+)
MIRVGLVGFGLAGRVFHAPLISSVEGLELAAVVERSTDEAARRYPGIAVYRTVEEMLADSSLNFFVVATPNATHFEVAKKLLNAGKTVVVDKPVAITSAEIAELAELAAVRRVMLMPFHNRRWDSDFRTLSQLIREDQLGRLVALQSVFDRWSPGATRRPWKNDPQEGGLLLDLGTHLVDQALHLFGKPETVSAEVRREREGEGSNDSFALRLGYGPLEVTLAANLLSALARPRFHARGIRGSYWKWGVDPQEAALHKVTRIGDQAWGEEPSANWGTRATNVDGSVVSCPVRPLAGDYRLFYAGVRDALLCQAHPPVSAVDAWRAARLLEWARESAEKRCEVRCDWSEEPE